MKKILHISSSPKIENSSSRKLGKEIIRKVIAKISKQYCQRIRFDKKATSTFK